MNKQLLTQKSNRRRVAINNLTDLKFGYLKVVSPSDEREQGNIKWICECECGTLVKRTHASLKKGGDKANCGCKRSQLCKERLAKPKDVENSEKAQKTNKPRENLITDIRGHKFGLLTVLRASDKREARAVKWECQCECGEIVYRSHRVLKASGEHASCGCLISRIRRESSYIRDKVVDGTNIAMLETTKLRTDNKSGVRGVCYHSQRSKWRAEIRIRGKTHYLGLYDTVAEAAAARAKAQEEIHQPLIDKYYENNMKKSN